METTRIAVVDVETPNGNNDSICSIGITIIENNTITEKKYYLVNPETHFDKRCVSIHGITESDVADSFTFPELWNRINNYFSGYLLAGHNLSFDLSVIKKTLKRYSMEYPPTYYIDTLNIARTFINTTNDYKLPTLCHYFNIELNNHHNSLEDSYATANLLIQLIQNYNFSLDDFIKQYSYKTKSSNTHHNIYCDTTRSLQELQGILFGVTCDGYLSNDEIYAIQTWAKNHIELKGNFPFDKIYSAIENVLEDNIITEEERTYLFNLFNKILNPVESNNTIEELSIKDVSICLTGEFECMPKAELQNELINRGAIIKKDVVKSLDFLIVGNKGSERWSQGNYGNKVKKAMQYNEKGCSINIIHENDFLDSIGFKKT